MLTRVFIDNFRCFVNFEFRPGSHQLILGGNGSGKSSLMDVLLLLRRFSVDGDSTAGDAISRQRTRWLDKREQVFELETSLAASTYRYRLVLDTTGTLIRVIEEIVHLNGKRLFAFRLGKVFLLDDRFEAKKPYELDLHRSALATVPAKGNTKLIRFRNWLGELLGFRLNPFAIGARAENEDATPATDLSNLPGWYRHLVQSNPGANNAFFESLRTSFAGFDSLQLVTVGENMRILTAEFQQEAGIRSRFNFAELSEGQRCLIALYMILHFVVAKGRTVIIDEPENFISLRELQPWLLAASDAIEDTGGQLLIVSHHPEFINQWAPDFGIRFVRDESGAARVEPFYGDPGSELSPAELIARGWENG